MDPNPYSNPPIGFILFGLAAVTLLTALIYVLGAKAAANMRAGRLNDQTDIPYPDKPQSGDDRASVNNARASDTGAGIATEEQLQELAVGDRRIVPQTPTSAERPADAYARDKEAHQVRASEAFEHRPADSGTSAANSAARDERSPL